MLAFKTSRLNSPIHRLNPITKIAIMLVFWMTALMTFKIPVLAVLLGISLCLYPLANISLFRTMKSILAIWLFIAVLFITINGFMFYGGKTPIFYLYKWPFTVEGVLFGVAVAMKILSVILLIPLVTMTTPLPKLMAAFSKLHLPYKFVFTLGMAMRLVPLITSTYMDILSAQRLRGHDLTTMNYVQRLIQGYVPLFTPLVLTMLRRSADMDIAIESRGFGTPGKRTYVQQINLTRLDYFAIAASLIVLGGIIFYLYQFGGLNFSLIIQAK